MVCVKTTWRVVLGLGVVGLFVFVLNYHLPLSGVKVVHYDFRAPDGTISLPYPVVRMKDVARGEVGLYRPMVEDPLYFDVKTAVPYTTARIDLVYQNRTALPLKIGMKLQRDVPGFDLKSFDETTQQDGWTFGTVRFDLSDASYYNSKYTFAFSVPGLKTERTDIGDVRLSSMTLTLEREPASLDDLWSFLRKK